MVRRNIDADLGMKPQFLPLRQLIEGIVDDPVSYFINETVMFNVGNKIDRAQYASVGMLPADQGLKPDHVPGAQVHFGLVGQEKLVQTQRLTDLVVILMLGFE